MTLGLLTVKEHTFRAEYGDYRDSALKEEDNFRINCHAYIPEKDFDYFVQDVLKMKKPKLNFSVSYKL